MDANDSRNKLQAMIDKLMTEIDRDPRMLIAQGDPPVVMNKRRDNPYSPDYQPSLLSRLHAATRHIAFRRGHDRMEDGA